MTQRSTCPPPLFRPVLPGSWVSSGPLTATRALQPRPLPRSRQPPAQQPMAFPTAWAPTSFHNSLPTMTATDAQPQFSFLQGWKYDNKDSCRQGCVILLNSSKSGEAEQRQLHLAWQEHLTSCPTDVNRRLKATTQMDTPHMHLRKWWRPQRLRSAARYSRRQFRRGCQCKRLQRLQPLSTLQPEQ